ncbi:hypothetical protein NXS98_13115 [Fontisphaera persica]|uniref:hypothetical protein n=1 Tax=Fontisphaera persica TaxID=2974023 RepID=UPI0024BF2A23|nr:hypothetical protein [Fontisphaera persica]WCJ58651.1 hypothetical protein NXS98_13115 [Fontisphaera persica]
MQVTSGRRAMKTAAPANELCCVSDALVTKAGRPVKRSLSTRGYQDVQNTPKKRAGEVDMARDASGYSPANIGNGPPFQGKKKTGGPVSGRAARQLLTQRRRRQVV